MIVEPKRCWMLIFLFIGQAGWVEATHSMSQAVGEDYVLLEDQDGSVAWEEPVVQHVAFERGLVAKIAGLLRDEGYGISAKDYDMEIRVRIIDMITYSSTENPYLMHAKLDVYRGEKKLDVVEFKRGPRWLFSKSYDAVAKLLANKVSRVVQYNVEKTRASATPTLYVRGSE